MCAAFRFISDLGARGGRVFFAFFFLFFLPGRVGNGGVAEWVRAHEGVAPLFCLSPRVPPVPLAPGTISIKKSERVRVCVCVRVCERASVHVRGESERETNE